MASLEISIIMMPVHIELIKSDSATQSSDSFMAKMEVSARFGDLRTFAHLRHYIHACVFSTMVGGKGY